MIGKQGNQGDKQVASLDKSIEVRPRFNKSIKSIEVRPRFNKSRSGEVKPQPEVEPPKLTSINSISECLCLFY